MVITAALRGLGVALGRSALVAQEIAAGNLVRPYEQQVPAEYSYYLLTRDSSSEQPKISAFQQWLLAQVSQFTQH